MSTASVISTNLYIEYSLHRRHPHGLSRQYFYKKKKRKTTINHYPRQISDDLSRIFLQSLSLWTQQTILTCKRIYIIQEPQSYCTPIEQKHFFILSKFLMLILFCKVSVNSQDFKQTFMFCFLHPSSNKHKIAIYFINIKKNKNIGWGKKTSLMRLI